MNATTTTTNGTTNGTGATLAPFQRNRYFYGKLMMVRDFLAEQVYMNGKRQLVNRLVDGWGIVCGLGVTGSGGSLIVSPGVAVDCCGKEIVVDQQVTVTIASLLNNTAPTTTSPYDLCLSYSECLQEPVTALANASSCEESCEYNRVQETYQLSLQPSTLTSRAASEAANEAAFGKTQQTIYQDANVLVQRLAPVCVNPGQVFAITFLATPAPQNAGGTFSVTLTITETLSSGLKMIQGLNAPSQFTNNNPSVGYWVQAPQTVGSSTVSASVTPSSGTNQVTSQPTTTIDVIAGSVSDQLVANYFANTLNSCPTCAQSDVIVLASFSVDSKFNVSNLTPPTQFVYDNLLLYYLISGLVQQSGQTPSLSNASNLLSASENGTLVQSGVTNLNFQSGLDVTAPSNGEANVTLDPNLTVQSLTLENSGAATAYPKLSSSAANVATLETNLFGIGTTTPRSSVEVVETPGGAGIGPILTLTNNSGSEGARVALDFNTFAPLTTGTYNPSSRIEAIDDGGWVNDIAFYSNSTKGANGGLVETMRIKSSGNVGIGTVTPTHLLEVSSPNASFAQMAMVSAGPDAAISLNNTASGGREYWIDSGSGTAGVGAGNFAIWDNTARSARFVVNSSGNVGIGTTAPTHLLEVSSPNANVAQMAMVSAGPDAAISLKNTASGGREYWIDSGSGTAGVGAGNFAIWDASGGGARLVVDSSGNVGIGTTKPTQKLDVIGNIIATGTITPSDERFKTNMTPLTGVLERVERIRGVSFDWNQLCDSLGRSSGRREIGLLAQDVEAVFPELVSTWGEADYKALDYGRLTAVLLEAIKELSAKLQSVSERLATLEPPA